MMVFKFSSQSATVRDVIKRRIFVSLLLAFMLCLSGCSSANLENVPFRALIPGAGGTVSKETSERQQALNLYQEAWQTVFTDYVDDSYNGQNWYRWKNKYDDHIQTKEDAYAAIRTMLASLNDSYTRFLDPQKAEQQNMDIDSRLFGVGIQLAAKENQLMVISPLEDSPAERAGIQALDQIIQINGEPTASMEIDEAVRKIRGPKGTTVELTLLRKGEKLTIKMIRDEIIIKTVFGDPVSKEIGYIRLSTFISQDATKEMRQKLEEQKHTKALIVDLRGNNGGLLPNALEISDMFLSRGDIVSIADRKGSRRTFKAQPGQVYGKPLVILIDEGSASASEILSGALKDNRRATLIGSKTFGKGLVQKINYLQDGSELNLTISRYYTPSGQDIDQKGIQPDIRVPYTEADFKASKDPQKEAAVRFLQRKLVAKAS